MNSNLRSPLSGPHAATLLTLLTVPLAAQSAWQLVMPAVSPSPRSYTTLVEDAARGRLVLFGGFSQSSTPMQDTWEWNGVTWQQVATSVTPPARIWHASCFDASRQRVVMFGGGGQGTTAHGDTWEYDGTNWHNRSPAAAPGARSGAGMVFDGNLQRVMLFGGFTTAGVTLNDTWTWNGVAWSQLNPTISPSIRKAFGMTWNPARQRTVVFGGVRVHVLGSELSDTWEFDGSNWSQLLLANPPAARWAHVLVHDASQALDVMIGGQPSNNTLLPGSWRLDGNGWAPTGGTVQPSGRTYPCMAYDSLRRQVVMFGGSATYWGNPPMRGDTWVYSNPNPATLTAFGNSCTGTAGLPRLNTMAGTGLWLGETTNVRLTPMPPQRLALFALGFSNSQIGGVPLPLDLTAQGMPGCRLYTSAESVLFAFSDFAGAAQIPIAVAANPALVGLTLHLQGIAADPATNSAGLITSNGLTARLGIR